MATTAVNNIKRSVAPSSVCEDATHLIDSSVSFNQGDLIAIVSNKLKAVSSDAETAQVIGVSRVTVSSGKLASPYSTSNDAALSVSEIPGPQYGVEVELTLNTGDAFNPGDLVYPIATVDAQTISSSSNSAARTACGVFLGAAVASASAGQKGIIRLGCPRHGGLL